MKKFYWFGDSWVKGDELEKILDKSWQKSAFPHLVSEHFGAECINLGENGIGPDYLPLQLSRLIKDIDPSNSVLFFFLSSDLRTWMFDEKGEIKSILPYPGFLWPNRHANWQKWYKYFDNPYQRSYNYDKAIDLLYFWSQHIGIPCWFANIFSTQPTPVMDLTSPDVWIVPRDQCIATAILPHIDNDSGLIFVNDIPTKTTAQWQEQQVCVEKFIRPLWCHPNVQGHRKIADYIIEMLEKKC